ncbi:MAG: tripartite tricarboxylate transporter substrate binding protein [Betaproteobacteria bacterium]|nr:tripartite tricarboxylate transporter substrate binding protein [Betaproteobacteria bacterium]
MRTSKAPLWLALLVLLACPLPALAQNYPEKSIRLVVAFPTGAAYILGLLVSDKLRESLGQSVVPDFRAGAGGNIAAELAAKAPHDGYTLLLTSGAITISPSLFAKLGYDTFRDFAPITLLATVPNVLVVHPSVPAKSLAELMKLAKAHPGKLNFGSGGVGSAGQLGSELFKALTKINIVHVPYKGATIALSAMLSGEVDMVTSTIPSTIPLVNSGRIRALAVMAPERAATLPQVPTSAEAGMPELVVITWYCLFAPAGVKPDIIGRLNAEVVKLMNSPETKNKLAQVGLDAATSTPAELGKFVRAEYEKWGRVIKAANIRVQQ